MSRLATVEEVADALRVSPATVRRQAKSGAIPGVRVGRQWRFDLDAVHARLNARLPVPVARPGRPRNKLPRLT